MAKETVELRPTLLYTLSTYQPLKHLKYSILSFRWEPFIVYGSKIIRTQPILRLDRGDFG